MPSKRQQFAVDLAKRAAIFIYMTDPFYVSGGCSRVSQTVGEFLRRQGFNAVEIFDFSYDKESGYPLEHVWLNVEGRELDLTWWVRNEIDRLAPYKLTRTWFQQRKSESEWRPSEADIRKVRKMLFCAPKYITPMLNELERAYAEGRLTRRHRFSDLERRKLFNKKYRRTLVIE